MLRLRDVRAVERITPHFSVPHEPVFFSRIQDHRIRVGFRMQVYSQDTDLCCPVRISSFRCTV